MRSHWDVGQSVGVGVGVGVGVLVGWWAWRKYNSYFPDFPTEWEEVGEVSRLVIYPLKSGKGITVDQADATEYGLADGCVKDRSLLVVTEDKCRFITGRQVPKLPTVALAFNGATVTLSAPNTTALTLDLEKVIESGNIKDSVVFSQDVKGYDCGDEVADWLTDVLGRKEDPRVKEEGAGPHVKEGGGAHVKEESPHVKGKGGRRFRLLYNANLTTFREANKPTFYQFKQYKPSDRVVYADACAYMLLTEASVHDLNKRLESPVTLDWFRPNIIVKGTRPYDEDDWAFVKIGDVVLRRLKPCDRCIFTTINPVKGVKTPDQEPLATLKRYRAPTEPPAVAKAWASSPMFGSHLGIDHCGTVRVGRKVFVARASSNYKWKY